jgi:hypothetical protein
MGSGQSTSSSSSGGGQKPTPIDVTDNVSQTAYTVASNIYKKRAVIIGINYNNTINQLNGCINDAQSAKELLEEWGFTTILMTENNSGNLYPTGVNILNQLTAEITNLSLGDCLVIYYSGHGDRITDYSNDEISGLDSVIVPVDYDNGLITDDIIREKLLLASSGAKIFSIFDSCNSASVCDLRYNLFDTSYRSNPGDKNSEIILRTKTIENIKYENTNAFIYSLSGCRDDELSVEFSVNGNACGALTYSLISYLKQATPNVNIDTLINNVRSKLISYGLSQNPQIMCGREPNTSLNFANFLNI